MNHSLVSFIRNKEDGLLWILLIGVRLFLLGIVAICVRNGSKLFLSSHGWSHRLAGAMHLTWWIVGAISIGTTMTKHDPQYQHQYQHHRQYNIEYHHHFHWWVICYDIILGISGIVTTITASRDFPHKYVENAKGQSGTLHSKAIVTQQEMIEHAFYQFLNLWQAMYLHLYHYFTNVFFLKHHHQQEKNIIIAFLYRMGLLWLVTAPWLVRHWLPVHSFSNNWKIYQANKQTQTQAQTKTKTQALKQQNEKRNSKQKKRNDDDDDMEVLLYRIKKSQYLFYKHVILHGVNLSLAIAVMEDSASISSISSSSISLSSSINVIPYSMSWRLFWLCLNVSYGMEFFLQTLVKRRVLSQSTMLKYQRCLMVLSSVSAIWVLPAANISILVCILSCILNFVHRHHDVLNTLVLGILFFLWNHCDYIFF